MNEDNEQTRGLSPDKEKLYLLAASQPLRDVATLMLETGMRPEEVSCIRHENVHPERGYLFNPMARSKLPSAKYRSLIRLVKCSQGFAYIPQTD